MSSELTVAQPNGPRFRVFGHVQRRNLVSPRENSIAQTIVPFLFFLISFSGALQAQTPCSPSGIPGAAGLQVGFDPFSPIPSGVPPATICVQTQLPKGQKLILVDLAFRSGRWQSGADCASNNCSSATVTFTLTGPSGALIGPVSLSGSSAPGPALGPDWQGGVCVEDGPSNCVYCIGSSCTGVFPCWQYLFGYLCKQQNPSYTFDDWLYSWKETQQFLDVSALTANGPVTLTLTGTAAGNPTSWPVQINGGVSSVAFKMQQTTSSTFRPRDARDPAATSGCDQNPTDCRQTFNVGLSGMPTSCGEAGPSSAKGRSPAQAPSQSRGIAQWLWRATQILWRRTNSPYRRPRIPQPDSLDPGLLARPLTSAQIARPTLTTSSNCRGTRGSGQPLD